MKFKTTLMLLLLSPLTTQAMMRAPLNPPTKNVADCDNRSNSLGGQMDDLQSLLHKVALVGEESGREVSSDPDSQEARNAEALGQSVTCGKNSGSLNLVEYKGKTVLIGTAHSYYREGNLKCDKDFGMFYPDDHYYPNPDSGVTFNRGYKFKLPPLNDSSALKGYARGVYSSNNLNDFVIFEIEDESVLERQLGGKRSTIKMEDISKRELKQLSTRESLTIVSSRKNFHEKMKVSYEEGCKILNVNGNKELKSHTCDTGQGSSGSSINYVDGSGQLRSVGIHYGSVEGANYFIPSENVLRKLDEIFPSKVDNLKAHTPISI